MHQAQNLANNINTLGWNSGWHGMMSKEDLARFISTDLALQCTKARLIMAVELDADQAVQPAGILERAEDFSKMSLGARSGQLAPLAAHHVHSERYDASELGTEPEQQAQWRMSVQAVPHFAHELHVSQPDCLPVQTWCRNPLLSFVGLHTQL